MLVRSAITIVIVAIAGALALSAYSIILRKDTDVHNPNDFPPNLHYYQPYKGPRQSEVLHADVCVYGATASGVVAAVQSRKLGRSVVLLEPGTHMGGMTSGGLSCTDFGNKRAIGGLAREFYRRCGKYYGVDEEWNFEPHVASEVLKTMASEAGVEPRYGEFLHSMEKKHNRIVSITMETGLKVEAKVYIDATYEGDLMAKAGVKYAVGREDNRTYGETLNGSQMRDKHQFQTDVEPWRVEGDPTSGVLPGIEPDEPEPDGTGDRRIQAYNFRLCLTKDVTNRIPFTRPKGYKADQYILLSRYLTTQPGQADVFGKFDAIRGNKVDKNNHGAISTDFIGMNYRWPEGSYAERERIFRAHVIYQMGLLWFLSNDPSVPEEVRTKMSEWGLCRDEFTDTGGWPFQLYIREARRMVSEYVVTELDYRGKRVAADSVGLASYGMDSHNCRRMIKDGFVVNEGDVQVGGSPPFPISYRSIVPKREQCQNLVVPVCVSASHIAYGSIRMEPVFMVLGQSSAIAADIAISKSIPMQDVPYGELRTALLKANQVLNWN